MNDIIFNHKNYSNVTYTPIRWYEKHFRKYITLSVFHIKKKIESDTFQIPTTLSEFNPPTETIMTIQSQWLKLIKAHVFVRFEYYRNVFVHLYHINVLQFIWRNLIQSHVYMYVYYTWSHMLYRLGDNTIIQRRRQFIDNNNWSTATINRKCDYFAKTESILGTDCLPGLKLKLLDYFAIFHTWYLKPPKIKLKSRLFSCARKNSNCGLSRFYVFLLWNDLSRGFYPVIQTVRQCKIVLSEIIWVG